MIIVLQSIEKPLVKEIKYQIVVFILNYLMNAKVLIVISRVMITVAEKVSTFP